MSKKIAVRCVELGIEFDSIGDASKAFGNYDSISNISNCIKGRTNTAYGYHWVAVNPIKHKTDNGNDKKNKKSSLCWECYRSVHFKEFPCPWAARFEPVEGWKAKVSHIKTPYGTDKTYHVIKCPLFMADDKRRTENE